MPEPFPTNFEIHRASPGQRKDRDWFLAFPSERLEIQPMNDGKTEWRLVFNGCTFERVVGHCQWDGQGGPLLGRVSFEEETAFHIAAHFYQRDDRTYMSAILMADRGLGGLDDPCATGGWTAQAQGGGGDGEPD